MGVGDVVVDDRSDPDGADPVGDVVGGGDSVLMQLFHQVNYQVR